MHHKGFLLILTMLLVIFLYQTPSAAETQPDRIEVMNREIGRNFDALKKEATPPYYISYAIDDVFTQYVNSSFGGLIYKTDYDRAYLTISMRVGSIELDNTHEIRGDSYSRFMKMWATPRKAPLDENREALAVILWQGTDDAYKEAVETLSKVKTDRALKVKEEDLSSDFTRMDPQVSLKEPLALRVDLDTWAEKTRRYSAPFRKYPFIIRANATFRNEVRNKYFVNTEGSREVAPINYMTLMIAAVAKADDGMELPLYMSYFGFQESDLPDDAAIMADIGRMMATLKALKTAPLVDPYTGPAILSGKASGVLFHEILGHRLEGHRQKSEEEGQTFKKKVNQKVLPDFISVIFDPTIRELNGVKLSGYYTCDDEGTPPEKVITIENGILKRFLMTRSPIQNFPRSNGHARCQPGRTPVARQSNLIVTSKKQLSEKELRQEMVKELKKQGRSFGLYFKEIQGGLTMTGRVLPNAFTVLPLVVYKVYVDGRPDELVRGVDLIGTPLTTFERIVATGSDPDVFNGTCGAESGSVPVSAVSPSILVSHVEVQKKARSQDKPPILPPPEGEMEGRR